MVKKQIIGIIFIMFCILPVGKAFAGETQFNLEITETTGDWEIVSPMFYKTFDDENLVTAKAEAININASNQLDYLQYFSYKWALSNNSIPDFGDHSWLTIRYDFEFNDDVPLAIIWLWTVEEDITTLYTGNLLVYINYTLWIDHEYYGETATKGFECHFWRTKSNQIKLWWKYGEGNWKKYTYGSVIISDWSISEFSMEVFTTLYHELSFTLEYDDFSYQCGSNEGIKDPISDETWGIFEPIRQILLFVMRLFIGLIKLVLPSELEDAFDDFLEDLGNFVSPIADIFIWIGENFIDVIIAVHMVLLLMGIKNAQEGEIKEVIMPFWQFYAIIGGIGFHVINFVVSIVKALIELLPF